MRKPQIANLKKRAKALGLELVKVFDSADAIGTGSNEYALTIEDCPTDDLELTSLYGIASKIEGYEADPESLEAFRSLLRSWISDEEDLQAERDGARRDELKAAWNDNAVRTMDSDLVLLVQAYRFHKARVMRLDGKRDADSKAAVGAIRNARVDVASKVRRYPSAVSIAWQDSDAGERLAYCADWTVYGLRHVGDVNAQCGSRSGYFNTRGKPSGWYSDNEQNETIHGVVYQLPGRKGKARFVAGYSNAQEDGATVDFGTVYEGESYWDGSPPECDAARDAATAADSMAETAAENEREYEAAWSAGNSWTEYKHEVADLRKEALEILTERRQAARDATTYPVICQVIRSRVLAIVNEIGEKRAKMRKLAGGDYVSEWLPGFCAEPRLVAAFNDGAGETVLG